MNSPIPYFGGKSRMAAAIIEKIPKHKTYAEVFGGAAWVLFKKPPSTVEALNDLDRHLMNFYRVAKYHSEALAAEIAALQPSRDLFYMLREELERPMMTDVQRAAVYYYLQRYAFAGRPGKPTLATSHSRPVRCRADVARRVIPQVADRLKEVMLENISWDRFIKLYDSPETFFFIDPPYIGHREYRHNFQKDDFRQLAEITNKIKGKFLMSHTDCDEIRNYFSKLNISEIDIMYSAKQLSKGETAMLGHEVLIANY